MSNEELVAKVLAKPLDVIVAVNRPDKGAQLSPLWFYWDGKDFYFSTYTTTAKYAHIKRDPNISVIVNDQATHAYVTAHGRAEILEPDEVDSSIVTGIVEKYVPDEQQRKQFIEATKANAAARVVVVLRNPQIFSLQLPGSR